MHHVSLILLLVALLLFLLLPWWLALLLCIPLLGFLVFATYKALQAMRRQPVTGKERMIGDRAVVSRVGQGQVEVHYQGESWQAVSSQPLHRGQTVIVQEVDGLTLRVASLPSSGNGDHPE